jgi:WD40 repeat protein
LEGRLLAWQGETLALVSFPSGELLNTWQPDPPVDGATWEAHFSQDARFITAKYGNRARCFDTHSGQALGPWVDASERFALSPDGAHLASAGTLGLSEDPSRVWVNRTRDGARLALFKTRAFYWRDLFYSPDGSLLVALGDDGQPTYAWIGRTPVFRWLEPVGYRAALSPDGLVFAASRTIHFLKTRKTLVLEYPPLAGTPVALAFSPAGDLLVTQTVEGGLYLWRVSDGSLLSLYHLPEGIAQVAFSPDGAWFTVLLQGAVYRYGLET